MIFFRTWLIVLLTASLSVVAAEKNIVQVSAPSIHKIVIFKNRKESKSQILGTAFFAHVNGKILGITNDHLCEHMIGPSKESFLRLEDGDGKTNYDSSSEALKIKSISMAMGQDLCFFTVEKGTPKVALELGSDAIKLDRIVVIGYPGWQFNVIAEDGYVSFTRSVTEPTALIKCPPLVSSHFDAIMCGLFEGFTLQFHNIYQYQITPNIGPGFSGSPVIDSGGKVIGLIARYVQPTDEYTNGHGLFIPVSEIKKYAAHIELVNLTDAKAAKFNNIVRAGKEIHDYLENKLSEEKDFLINLLKGLLRESNGS